jgi:hypothetical protein
MLSSNGTDIKTLSNGVSFKNWKLEKCPGDRGWQVDKIAPWWPVVATTANEQRAEEVHTLKKLGRVDYYTEDDLIRFKDDFVKA